MRTVITEEQRKCLIDILENMDSLYKISIDLDHVSRKVTIIYDGCDDEWFRELQASMVNT